MIVISSDLVLDSDGLTLDHPIIGWQNIVTIDNIAADTADANFPVSNLANPATHLRWQAADTSVQYITITTGTADDIDYVGIAKHNFGSAAIAISVEGDDGGGFDELIAPFIPVNDGPIICRVTPQAFSAVRIKLATGAAVARAAVVFCGKLLVMPRRLYQGFTPTVDGRKSKVTNGRSESGNFTGRIVTGRWIETTASFTLIDPTYYREHIREFVEASVETPFFFGWRPESYPNEAGYMWMTADPKPVNAAPSGLVAVDFPMSGIV